MEVIAKLKQGYHFFGPLSTCLKLNEDVCMCVQFRLIHNIMCCRQMKMICLQIMGLLSCHD